MYPIMRVPVQQTRLLNIRQTDDAWIVWLAGTPETKDHTYLVLYNTGRVERICEGDGSIDVLVVYEGKEQDDGHS